MSTNEQAKKVFDGFCPYTNEQCETFNCDECPIQAREKEWLAALDASLTDEAGVNAKKRTFVALKAENTGDMPYYSILYIEDGNGFEGYCSYDLDVISRYIRDYFING